MLAAASHHTNPSSELSVSEILNLKWNDVNEVDNHFFFREHKTSRKKGAKIVPVGEAVMDLLRTVERRSEYVCAGLENNRIEHTAALFVAANQLGRNRLRKSVVGVMA